MNDPPPTSDRQRLAALAVKVIEADPGERDALIAEATANRPDLQDKLVRIIEESSSPDAGDPLDALGEIFRLAVADMPSEPFDQSGTQIDRYRLVRLLGAGAYGAVYLAEQEQPVRRSVAIKVIKLGMDSASVLARFEQERQVLALMDHPGVARILDGGATTQGTPYFVMEYVDGDPITVFCDRNRLGVKNRLSLFASVCEAVQHAHMRGVIHRDLKPSNILVHEGEDNTPRAKVIDFGIAKAVLGPTTPAATLTQRDELVGTLEYMSPEQARGGSLGVDVRADVYSLGAVLYELLAGQLPFDPKDLRARGTAGACELISTKDPLRPSARLAAAGEAAGTIAGDRSMSVSTLTDSLRRELEWIPLYAMRKDREHRYQSVQQLGDDIRAYLRGHALVAGPESTTYRVRKFARRHRTGVAVGVAIMAALGLGAFGLTAGLLRANAALRIADARADQLDRLSAFLEQTIGGVDPVIAQGMDRQLFVRVLQSSEAALDATSFDAPREFRVRLMLARAYQTLGEPEHGRPHVRRLEELQDAAQPDALSVAQLLEHRYWLLKHDNEMAESELLLNDMIAHCDARLGRTSIQAIHAVCWLADTHAVRRDGVPQREDVIRSLLADAESRAVEGFGKGSEQHADVLHAASTVLHFLGAGSKEEAAEYGSRAVQMYADALGPGSVQSIAATARLASHLLFVPDYDECIRLYRSVVESARQVLGEQHSVTSSIHSGLGRALLWREKPADLLDAIEHLTTAVDLYRSGGPRHRGAYLSSANWLVIALSRNGQLQAALELARESSEVAVEVAHVPAFDAIVAVVCQRSGEVDQDALAEQHLISMYSAACARHGDDTAIARSTAKAVAAFHKRKGNEESAREWAARGSVPVSQ
ncbi:MAG: serine/threonine protein kinase [Phycisphaeraceae bacterium]|nr:serine/threonine protein kinase [Phycisphaeraceae bacterium]